MLTILVAHSIIGRKRFLNGYVVITVSSIHYFPPGRAHQHLLAAPSGAPA